MKKTYKYFSIISLIIFISISIYCLFLNNLDELWNFNNSRNIVNGLLPYKDFSIIVTPLYALINSITLKIFGNYLYIYRINYIVIFLSLLIMIHLLLKKLKVTFNYQYFLLLLLGIFIPKFCYSDYNFFNSFIIIIIIYLEIVNKNKKHNNLFVGLLGGLSVLTKQTTGLIVCMTIIFIPLVLKYYLKKEIDLKQFLLQRVIGILIPISVFLIYLFVNNLWLYFFDYTILGIKEFSNNLFEKELIPIIIIYSILLIGIIYKAIKEKSETYTIFIIYSISSLVLIYPICDLVHLLVGIIPLLVLTMYYLYNQNLKIKKEIFSSIIILISCLLLYNSYQTLNQYFNCSKGEKYYKNIAVKENILSNINLISNYVKENDNVIILNYQAAIYMIASDKYNKNYDLFMNGNFGINGNKKLINDLDSKDYTILINQSTSHYQEPKEVIEYVSKKYIVKGYIGNFTIFSKK